ncbi:hypothetical protein BURPS1106B_2572 [Burkholderia pseudomallei 1106b]|uniref:Uncharacterized protein n=1 Tax=Burkholderia pseudomallei (strain 1106a) TaxID=357348 RepID=A3P8H3_BURP0|nr:hypothetical protein BURPS1106A_A2603 [Burkholderia pseudomallei 1106a]EES21593.1 hypothetical protein BURPS1106B_2572 [Burkholderia pseudomallei 1106b]
MRTAAREPAPRTTVPGSSQSPSGMPRGTRRSLRRRRRAKRHRVPRHVYATSAVPVGRRA